MLDLEQKKVELASSRALASKIKSVIDARGVKYAFIAERLGMNKTKLSLFLNGHRVIPAQTRLQLEKELGVTFNDETIND